MMAAEALRQRHHTDRQRRPRRDVGLDVEPLRSAAARTRSFEIEPDELRRAAADVEHEHIVGAVVDERGATRHGEVRLRLAVEKLDPDAGLALDPMQEVLPVLGDAARLRSDAARPHHRIA